jgi:predicted aminopeptidase
MRVVLLAALALPLSGCGLGYYWQATAGHLGVMNSRTPVEQVLSDPATPEALGKRLEYALAARDFAYQSLALPDRGSYRHYADLERPYVVWNVVATTEFSLVPQNWCYPVAGCVSYRGYFAETAADRLAGELRADGNDVMVGGVRAYSTLGRFDDPLLNTFMDLPRDQLAGLIFHELAHQRLYIRDDSVFNESFATAVEREGLRLWLAGDDAGLCALELRAQRRAQVDALLADARVALEQVYASALGDEEKRAAKARVFAELSSAYEALRATWSGPPYFDGWLRGELNNALLAALATYNDYVPAFTQLLREVNGDWQLFYQRASEIGALPENERAAALGRLTPTAVSGPRVADKCSAPPVRAASRAPRAG